MGSKPFEARKVNPTQTKQNIGSSVCLNINIIPKPTRLWRHFHPRASAMEDAEQLGILWAITQHP